MQIKKIFTAILSMVLILAIALPSMASSKELKDLDSSIYKSEIEKLIEDEIISGYSDGTFRPKNHITRGELSKILVLALDLEENKEAAEHFIDVKGKWSQGYVGALCEAGIMVGHENKFGQDRNVNREELATILLRVFELEETVKEMDLSIEFSDADKVSDWAKDGVAFVSKIGLMNGIESKDFSINFQPKAFAERELVAKLGYEIKYNKKVYEKLIKELLGIGDIEKPEEKPKDELTKKETTEKDKPQDTETKGKKEENKPSYDSIVSKYHGELLALESSVDSELSSLISQAKEEYNNGVSAGEILSKYKGKVSSLEASTDAKVESILSSLSNELSTYDYDTSIVDEFRAEYQEKKDSARGSIEL